MFNLYIQYPTHTYVDAYVSLTNQKMQIYVVLQMQARRTCGLLICEVIDVLSLFQQTPFGFVRHSLRLCVQNGQRWTEKLIRTLSFYLNFKFVFEANKKKGIEMFQMFEELLSPVGAFSHHIRVQKYSFNFHFIYSIITLSLLYRDKI